MTMDREATSPPSPPGFPIELACTTATVVAVSAVILVLKAGRLEWQSWAALAASAAAYLGVVGARAFRARDERRPPLGSFLLAGGLAGLVGALFHQRFLVSPGLVAPLLTGLVVGAAQYLTVRAWAARRERRD